MTDALALVVYLAGSLGFFRNLRKTTTLPAFMAFVLSLFWPVHFAIWLGDYVARQDDPPRD